MKKGDIVKVLVQGRYCTYPVGALGIIVEDDPTYDERYKVDMLDDAITGWRREEHLEVVYPATAQRTSDNAIREFVLHCRKVNFEIQRLQDRRERLLQGDF